MKKLTVVFVITNLLLNAMAPTLAHAATYLQGTEVNANSPIATATARKKRRGGGLMRLMKLCLQFAVDTGPRKPLHTPKCCP